jgi:hypothetical protein
MKLRRLDRTGVFALAAVLEALADAGFGAGTDRDEAGVVVGTFSAGGEATQDYLQRLHDSGPSGAPALIFHSTVGNAAASLAGLEMKLRQYEQGKRFCDAVVREGGIAALNRVWRSPATLPTLAELDHPSSWLRRTDVPALPSA